MNILTFIFFCFLSITSFGQCEYWSTKAHSVEESFSHPEVSPMPNGGLSEFYDWVKSDINLFGIDDSLSINHKVFVQFTVKSNGQLSEKYIVKGIGEPYDSEACRLISEYPKGWIPGSNRGRKMDLNLTLPIFFAENKKNK